MRGLKPTLMPFMTLWLWPTLSGAAPAVDVLPKGLHDSSLPPQVIYQTERHYLTRHADAKPIDFQDLYVINLSNTKVMKKDLRDFGSLVHYQPEEFAVIKLATIGSQEAMSAWLHEQGAGCGAMFRLRGDLVSSEPALAPEPIHPIATSLQAVENAVQMVGADNIKATVEELSAILTRHHSSPTGKGIAQLMGSKYQSLAASRADVGVASYNHGSNTAQPSMIIRIPGTTRPDEIVILGSHIDSISFFGGRSPGADDNASGTATNLEVFRVLMAQGWRFERTIEIHGYAAEEAGLVGSQDIALKYKQAGKNVVAMMQIDMDIFRDGSEDKIWFITNSTSRELNIGLEGLVDRYVHVPWSAANLSGGSSDHASWTRQGFAASFPFENPQRYNRNIHSENDTIANSGAFTQARAFAKLGLAFLGHYAGIVL